MTKEMRDLTIREHLKVIDQLLKEECEEPVLCYSATLNGGGQLCIGSLDYVLQKVEQYLRRHPGRSVCIHK